MELWQQGPVEPGEGIYACYNRGSCILPDNCTCPDGWAGHDCNQRTRRRRRASPWAPLPPFITPHTHAHTHSPVAGRPTALCRHRNAFDDVVTCQNDAVCVDKDSCTCITARPALYELYPALENRRGAEFETGWDGSDCSIGATARCLLWRGGRPALTRDALPPTPAKCTQGFLDQSCQGVASGGEGCYRCLNGGNCTAPDLCTCTSEYRGFDCGEGALPGIAPAGWRGAAQSPGVVCGRAQRSASSARPRRRSSTWTRWTWPRWRRSRRTHALPPCVRGGGPPALGAAPHAPAQEMVPTPDGLKQRGNCTAPDTCECLCITPGEPWSDPLGQSLPRGVTFGTGECADGFEGTRAADGRFLTCHLRKHPTPLAAEAGDGAPPLTAPRAPARRHQGPHMVGALCVAAHSDRPHPRLPHNRRHVVRPALAQGAAAAQEVANAPLSAVECGDGGGAAVAGEQHHAVGRPPKRHHAQVPYLADLTRFEVIEPARTHRGRGWSQVVPGWLRPPRGGTWAGRAEGFWGV